MNEDPRALRKCHRRKPLPSIAVDVPSLKRIFQLFADMNKEAFRLEWEGVSRGGFKDGVDPEELRQRLQGFFQVTVKIVGSDGDYMESDSISIFEENFFPGRIQKIVFDNTTVFNLHLKRNPNHFFSMLLDFTKPELIDFSISPTNATANESNVIFSGESTDWVEAGFQRIWKEIDDSCTVYRLIHQKNMYDLLLWFVVFPLVLWNLHKINSYIEIHFNLMHSFLKGSLFVYIVIIGMFALRVLWGYGRWCFPFIDFISSRRRKESIHRATWVILFTSFLSILVSQLVGAII